MALHRPAANLPVPEADRATAGSPLVTLPNPSVTADTSRQPTADSRHYTAIAAGIWVSNSDGTVTSESMYALIGCTPRGGKVRERCQGLRVQYLERLCVMLLPRLDKRVVVTFTSLYVDWKR